MSGTLSNGLPLSSSIQLVCRKIRRWQNRLAPVCIALVLLSGGQAQEKSGEGSLLAREEAAFRAAVEAAESCVVQIETFGGLERVGDELIAEGPTTGTIVDSDGWIISSLYSFRQQPASILVTLPSGKRVPAEVIARDTSRELALLKVAVDEGLQAAKPAAALPPVGSWTVALGKTYDATQVSQSVGIVSALGRAYGKAIQTDAKVSPINYGGPLIDLQGQVLGILAPISPGTFFEGDSSELYDSGIGFAIPLSDIIERLPRMQKGQDIQAGKLGIVSTNQNELAGPVRLTGAAPGSPAAKAGLKAGDVIIEAEGKPIYLLAELRHALAPIDAGKMLHFAVQRGGERIELECELVAEIPVYRRRFLGLRLADDAEDAGVLITGIEVGSPAAKSDLHIGERLTVCAGQPVANRADLAGRLAVAELDQPLVFTVVAAGGEVRQVEVVPTIWPSQLPTDMPLPAASVDTNLPIQVTDISLGDVTNKAFALVPPAADQRRMGLLMVFPEPGELDRDKTKVAWEKFCIEQGWIVVVINSASSQAWSMEEVELASRLLGRLNQTYSLDRSRCVTAGLGVGGRVALAAASVAREQINGVVTFGTDLRGFTVRQPNAPLQSLDFLLVGKSEELETPASALIKRGYAAHVVSAPDLKAGAWETVPLQPVTLWLEGLSRL
ncbi:MAG: PDZ domain-containing protein [Pirellulaceae bacterium]